MIIKGIFRPAMAMLLLTSFLYPSCVNDEQRAERARKRMPELLSRLKAKADRQRMKEEEEDARDQADLDSM